MNVLRKMHLFLGCFFAPLLIFFVCSGWYQTTHEERNKDPRHAEGFFNRMRSVHTDSLLPSEGARDYSPRLFKTLVVIMSVALLATTALGIILAFRFSRQKWMVWLTLSLGFAMPILLLVLGQKR